MNDEQNHILVSHSSDLAFFVAAGSPEEPMAEHLFQFHETAMEHSPTFGAMMTAANEVGKVAVYILNKHPDTRARTSWIEADEDLDEKIGYIELFRSGLEAVAEVLPEEERSEGIKRLAERAFINEIHNASIHDEFYALNQAARNGDFAHKELQTGIDQTLARYPDDGPAVHYAIETERLEDLFVGRMDSVYQEIRTGFGHAELALSPRESFEERLREQIELGHTQHYLEQYDRITRTGL